MIFRHFRRLSFPSSLQTSKCEKSFFSIAPPGPDRSLFSALFVTLQANIISLRLPGSRAHAGMCPKMEKQYGGHGAAWPALATRTARDFWLRPSACLPRRVDFQDFGLRPSACLPRIMDSQDSRLRPSTCLPGFMDFQDFRLRPSTCLPGSMDFPESPPQT